jgi:hypothetical protein
MLSPIFHTNKNIVLKSVGRRIMQRACPTLVERPNDRDALDLADVEGNGEDVAVAIIKGTGVLLVAIRTLLAALVGAA